MKQIFELTEKDFMTGIAPSSQVQDKGLWHRAHGITAFRDISSESDDVGVLQAAPEAVDLTGSVIEDTPFAWTIDPKDPDTGFAKLYIWGRDGWLYSIDLIADNAPVNLNAAQSPPLSGMTDAANGIFIMLHSTGDKKVWYFRKVGIGYYGILGSSPDFNNDQYTSDIEETEDHPTHRFFDRVYFGNGRYIGQCEDDLSGGLTVTGHALDFETDDTVKTISDDGTYLVAGITKNTTVNPDTRGRSRVIFWDTNQSSWQREWEIPDGTIFAIRRNGAFMEAVTTRGVFAFNFSTPPEPVFPYFNTLGNVPNYPIASHFAADVLGQVLLWGGFDKISTFGKITPAMPTAYFEPFAQFGDATVTLVIANATANTIFVGTDDDKLFRVHLDAAGVQNVMAETIYIDLKRWYQVGRVTLGFDGPLVDDDEVTVTMMPDDASDEFQAGTASFDANGPVRMKELYCTLEARKLKLLINFADGSPRIRNIQVWGDPIETPTHTRANVGVPVNV